MSDMVYVILFGVLTLLCGVKAMAWPPERFQFGWFLLGMMSGMCMLYSITLLPSGEPPEGARDTAARALQHAAVACKDADVNRDETLTLSADGQAITTHSHSGYACLVQELDSPGSLNARVNGTSITSGTYTNTDNGLDWAWSYREGQPPGFTLVISAGDG